MVDSSMPSFLESMRFPAQRISIESAREKTGGGRPEFWEMVFWWTRKPLISARGVIAAALLEGNVDLVSFYRLTGLDSGKVPHRVNPKVTSDLREKLSRIRLLDTFAGFGSIPLEAVRLGLGEVVAVEFLPTAYVFLKAVLEIPKWAVERGIVDELKKDLEKWGSWIVERIKEDPDIKELYEPDVAVYIGTWEVKCPYCNKYTPLVGNYWLARVGEESGRYSRLAWVEPLVVNDRVEFKVVNLNKELGVPEIPAKISENAVETSKGTYRVPEANIDAKTSWALCLHCNRIMPGKGDDWHVKQALRECNNNLERYLNGEISLNELKQSKARPRLIVKVKVVNKDLEFEPATQEDNEKLWRALEKLRAMWGDPDIPVEPVPIYENRRITPILGAEKWYQFFNPRQLLTLVKLVKLVREAGKRVEEEKLKQGWSKEDAYKYAEAVTTYLAIALIRYTDFNSIVSHWTITWLIPNEALAMRGIAMVWNYGEYSPYAPARTGNWLRNIENIIEGLSYLINAVSGSSSRVRVLLDDTTSLSRLGDGKFELIVTDPPYRDDVPYAELSDFYYMWLKRALSDSDGVSLKPRFYPEAFFECLDTEYKSYVEIRTQWERFAPLEISVNEGRADFFKKTMDVEAGSDRDFQEKLARAFMRMAELLKDDGLIVTYYAHTDPSAWEALIEAGWKRAGLRVTAAYVIATESEQRVTARGKVALDASVVVVWRKGVSRVGLLHEVEREALKEAVVRVEEAIKTRGVTLDINLFLRSLAITLSVFTSYSKLIPEINTRELVEKAFQIALRGLVEGVYRHAGIERPLDPYASTYLALKVVTRPSIEESELQKRGKRKAEIKRGRVDKTFAVLLGVFSGVKVDSLVSAKILAKAKEDLELLEPEPSSLTEPDIKVAFEELLLEKGVDPARPETLKTSVDSLHYLELKALQLTTEQFKGLYSELESRNPRVAEAVYLAKALYTVLPKIDPERICCERILQHLGLLRLGGFR
jgi:putative DNA methylase